VHIKESTMRMMAAQKLKLIETGLSARPARSRARA